ncbi:Type III restriction enzyme, res subunit [Seminavis robusta]|uniref:Type III restriction enzyme, res subunit n=1 Tax=Seminavis robusta TaxID=568900 RepID=A0A9N8H3N3_9STRA|nr:Type III restriction enzyme, res subunit [Seminavis robusta]|eukprot:Sro30_g019670.1 Type III restriction enzyme, res subunit (614) ;mRNA; r:90058-91899
MHHAHIMPTMERAFDPAATVALPALEGPLAPALGLPPAVAAGPPTNAFVQNVATGMPPPLPRMVYGVRRGKGGVRGCIFLKWEDCAPFVSGNGSEIEYRVFSNVMDAAHYAMGGPTSTMQHQQPEPHPTTAQQQTAVQFQPNHPPFTNPHAPSLEPLPFPDTLQANDNKQAEEEAKRPPVNLGGESESNAPKPAGDGGRSAITETTQTAKDPPPGASPTKKPKTCATICKKPKSKHKQPKRHTKASPYWMQQYEDFKSFLESNSLTCATLPEPVPDHKQNKFVKEQRLEYRYMKQGLETKMIPDKIDKLRALGFDFQYQSLLDADNQKWEQMLKEYKAYHNPRGAFGGNTTATTTTQPQRPAGAATAWENNPNIHNTHDGAMATTTQKKQSAALRDWKHAQRVQFQNLQEGKRSSLTPDRIQKLNDAGFIFMPRSNFRTMTWEERIQQLQDYKEKHGNLNIPSNHPELGFFVSNTRRSYKYLHEGKKTAFTHEKANQLAAMGFSFLVGKRKSKPVELKTWDEQFELLREFKAAHGHTIVPQHYPGLGRWVKQMRREFKLMKEGKRSTLSPEKVLRLADIGFVFDAQFRRGSKISDTDYTKVGGNKVGGFLHHG